jgi:hypothetical protein
MLQLLIQHYITIFLSGNWELTKQPTSHIIPQTINFVAGSLVHSLVQFDQKIQQNPDLLIYLRNSLGVSGFKEMMAVYQAIPAK